MEIRRAYRIELNPQTIKALQDGMPGLVIGSSSSPRNYHTKGDESRDIIRLSAGENVFDFDIVKIYKGEPYPGLDFVVLRAADKIATDVEVSAYTNMLPHETVADQLQKMAQLPTKIVSAEFVTSAEPPLYAAGGDFIEPKPGDAMLLRVMFDLVHDTPWKLMRIMLGNEELSVFPLKFSRPANLAKHTSAANGKNALIMHCFLQSTSVRNAVLEVENAALFDALEKGLGFIVVDHWRPGIEGGLLTLKHNGRLLQFTVVERFEGNDTDQDDIEYESLFVIEPVDEMLALKNPHHSEPVTLSLSATICSASTFAAHVEELSTTLKKRSLAMHIGDKLPVHSVFKTRYRSSADVTIIPGRLLRLESNEGVGWAMVSEVQKVDEDINELEAEVISRERHPMNYQRLTCVF